MPDGYRFWVRPTAGHTRRWGVWALVCAALVVSGCAVESTTVLSRQDMSHDLLRLGRILGDAHPSVNRVISREAWDEATAKTVAELPESLPRAAYLQRVAGLLDSLQGGHVGVGPRGLAYSTKFGVVSKRVGLPVQLRYTTDAGIVIARTSPNIDTLLRGRTVTAIDGQPMADLVAEAARLAGGSDGRDETAARDRGLQYLRSYLAWRDGARDSFRLRLSPAGNADDPETEVVVPAFTKAFAKTRADSLRKVARAEKRARKRNDEERLPPTPTQRTAVRRPIAYGYDTLRKVAVIELHSMSGYDPYNLLWPLALRRVFAKARKDGAKGLVVDLRGNGGGRSANVHRVLSHLVRAPTPLYRPWQLRRSAWRRAGPMYQLGLLPPLILGRGETVRFGRLMRHRVHPRRHAFEGPVAVLIDSRTFSAATITASVLASSRRAPLLGQASGGNYHETYAGLFAEKSLRRTGLKLRVPLLLIPVDVDPRRQPFSYTLRPALTLPLDRAHVLAKADLNLLEALEFVGSRGSAPPPAVPEQ